MVVRNGLKTGIVAETYYIFLRVQVSIGSLRVFSIHSEIGNIVGKENGADNVE